jgi:beta-galactosidase
VETSIIQSLPDVEANGVHALTQIGADGLLARMALGKGVALFCQCDPERLQADTKTYLRFTRWRQTHTLCLLLSNMGASFRQDALIFHPTSISQETPGFYHPDYRTDFELGDNPYRYHH